MSPSSIPRFPPLNLCSSKGPLGQSSALERYFLIDTTVQQARTTSTVSLISVK